MSRPESHPRIDTFLVDIGQVLVGLDVQQALATILPFTPLEAAEIRSRLSGDPVIVDYETGRISTEEFHDRFCALAELSLSLDEFAKAWEKIFAFGNQQPGRFLSATLFRQLKERYRLVALSNTNPLHFQHLWKRLPLVHEFDDYLLSHEAGCVKPEEAIFWAALDKAKRSPERVFFVDDLRENVEAASRLGIDGVVFENEPQLRLDLASRGLLASAEAGLSRDP